MNPIPKWLPIVFLIVSFLGFLDAAYLTIEHYRGVPPPCTILEGCEEVTTSKYAAILGVPVALGGSAYYLVVFILSVLFLQLGQERFIRLAFRLTVLGFLASLWFLYLQFFVINAICIYCMFSVITSTTLFVLAISGWKILKRV